MKTSSRITKLLMTAGIVLLAGSIRAHAIDIDSAWLSAHTAPYKLDQNGATYVLKTDVTTNASAFLVATHNVSIDLNGYTVTYDNVAPITVNNSGFETGDFTGWDISGMPHVSIGSVATVPGLWGKYCAMFTVPASATPAKETMVSSPINVPEAGVLYEAAMVIKGIYSWGPTITLSVIDDATNVVIASATPGVGIIDSGVTIYTSFTPTTTHPVRYQLDITPPVNKTCTVAIDYATLDRTAVYGLSFGFNLNNFRLTSSISRGTGAEAGAVTVTNGAVTAIAVASPGSGYSTPPTVIVTNNTGPTTGLGARAHAIISGGQVAGFVIDDGGNGYQTAIAYVLSGGRIVQGTGSSTRSTPINDRNATSPFTVDGVGVSATGRDSQLIDMAYSSNVTVRNCTLIAGLSNISNRQAANAMLRTGGGGGTVDIEGNVLRGAHQNGIVVRPDGTLVTGVTVKNNDIRHNSTWGNSYGIGIAAVKNFEVAFNTILPIAGRGILMEATMQGHTEYNLVDGSVHDNMVVAQERANLEYGSGIDAAALRMRNYYNEFGTGYWRNVMIYNNSFIALAGSAPGMSMFAAGGKFNFQNPTGALNNCNVVFRHNLFKGIVVDPTLCPPNFKAYGISFCVIDAGTGMSYIDNTVESNMIPLNFGDADGINESDMTLVGNTVVSSNEGAHGLYRGITMGSWTSNIKDVRLVDAHMDNGNTPQLTFDGGGYKDAWIGWLLSVNVVDAASLPISGATVSVESSTGGVVFNGTTDANGHITDVTVLTKEYTIPAGIDNSRNWNPLVTFATPHTVTASLGTQSASQQLSMAANTTLTLTLSDHVTTYTLNGPSGVVVGHTSDPFTVTPNGTYLGTITPDDGGAGGVFVPAVLSWSATTGMKSFTYSAGAAGPITIRTHNSGGLSDPSSLAATAKTMATAYTLTGPAFMIKNKISSNFTITPNGVFTGTITITASWPSPKILYWHGTDEPQTFTCIMASVGTMTASASDSGPLIDPPALTIPVLDNSPVIPPTILTQPVGKTVMVGTPATFSVVADGTPTPTYRWLKNGITIPGAISPTYTTPPTTLADNGAKFSCVASNDGGTAASGVAVLTVNPVGTPTNPTASVTFPLDGDIVNGTVNVSANATGDTAVTKVELYIDEKLLAIATSLTSLFSWSWDTTTISNGVHSLIAKAYDAANNIGTSAAVSVTVANSVGGGSPPGNAPVDSSCHAEPNVVIVGQTGPLHLVNCGNSSSWNIYNRRGIRVGNFDGTSLNVANLDLASGTYMIRSDSSASDEMIVVVVK